MAPCQCHAIPNDYDKYTDVLAECPDNQDVHHIGRTHPIFLDESLLQIQDQAYGQITAENFQKFSFSW